MQNVRLVGYCDQGGRSDGVQIMVHRGYAYVGHIFSKGFSVIDVHDPKNPKQLKIRRRPHNTWSLHLQTREDLLYVINNKDMFAQPDLADEKAYYKGAVDKHAIRCDGTRLSAGLAVYDISKPSDPKPIKVRTGGRNGPAPALVRWRALGLRLGADRRLFRLHPHHHRHGRPDQAAVRRQILAAGHECHRRRDAELASRRTAASGCITPSFTRISLIAAGATPASRLSISRIARPPS